MVDIKTAVATAIKFAKDALGPERTSDIRLEEIESAKIDKDFVWLITLSIPLTEQGPLGPIKTFAAALGADAGREYKVFTIEKYGGEVLSMKIRVLATPETN